MLVRTTRLVALILALHIVSGVSGPRAEETKPHLCTEDAMIVFDASGSMYGDGWGYASTSRMSRIDNAKSAIANVRLSRDLDGLGSSLLVQGPTTNATSNLSLSRRLTRRTV